MPISQFHRRTEVSLDDGGEESRNSFTTRTAPDNIESHNSVMHEFTIDDDFLVEKGIKVTYSGTGADRVYSTNYTIGLSAIDTYGSYDISDAVMITYFTYSPMTSPGSVGTVNLAFGTTTANTSFSSTDTPVDPGRLGTMTFTKPINYSVQWLPTRPTSLTVNIKNFIPGDGVRFYIQGNFSGHYDVTGNNPTVSFTENFYTIG